MALQDRGGTNSLTTTDPGRSRPAHSRSCQVRSPHRALEALGTLNDRYQQAITLRYLSGLSHEESADAMGISKPVICERSPGHSGPLKKAMDQIGPPEEEAS